MIAKGPLILSKEQKLSKEVIEASFGARLRSLGFVSRKNGTEWYAILKEKLFCSIYLDEKFFHNVLYRVQPLCSRIINPLKPYKHGVGDKTNYCESAVWIWRKTHSSEYEKMLNDLMPSSNDEFIQGKVEFFLELFNNVVFPYLESLNDYSDIVCEKDRYLDAACAYLTADSDRYYNNKAVFMALTQLYRDNSRPEEENEFEQSVRQAAEQKNMSILGKCLQFRERENIALLKEKLPKLFKTSSAVKAVITDDFINNRALKEARTTYDYSFSIPKDIAIEGIEYRPFPMSPQKFEGDANLPEKVAEELIRTRFADIVKTRGFAQLGDDVFRWYKHSEYIYYYIEFRLAAGSLFVDFNALSLYDDIFGDEIRQKTTRNCAQSQLNKLVGAPIPHEFYPNALVGTEEAILWQISRIDCQLHYVIFPFFESIKTLRDVAEYSREYSGEYGGTTLYLANEHRVKQPIDILKMKRKYGELRLNKQQSWRIRRLKILEKNDVDYLMYFLEECKRHNLKVLNNLYS